MDEPSAIAERLKQARLAKGKNVKEWAELLGDTASRITDVERGKQKPPQELVVAAVQRAGVSPTWLMLGGDAPMFTEKGKGRLSPEQTTSLVQLTALKLARMNVSGDLARTAQEWLLAVELGDAEYLERLALAPPRVSESVASYGPAKRSDGAPIDRDILCGVLESTLDILEREKLHVRPKKLAELILIVYDHAVKEGTVNRAAVLRLVRLAS